MKESRGAGRSSSMVNRPWKEDRWPCIPLASESLCCQKAPFFLPDGDFLSDRARGIDPLCLSIESRPLEMDHQRGEIDLIGQPAFLLISTAVTNLLSPSCKTGPFPEQMSEVASTGGTKRHTEPSRHTSVFSFFSTSRERFSMQFFPCWFSNG